MDSETRIELARFKSHIKILMDDLMDLREDFIKHRDEFTRLCNPIVIEETETDDGPFTGKFDREVKLYNE